MAETDRGAGSGWAGRCVDPHGDLEFGLCCWTGPGASEHAQYLWPLVQCLQAALSDDWTGALQRRLVGRLSKTRTVRS